MNKDIHLIYEAYLTESDEAMEVGKEVLLALKRNPQYHLVRDERIETSGAGLIMFEHDEDPITVEFLGVGDVLAFMQIKWFEARDEFPRNKDMSGETIVKLGSVGIMVELEKIEHQVNASRNQATPEEREDLGLDDEPEYDPGTSYR